MGFPVRQVSISPPGDHALNLQASRVFREPGDFPIALRKQPATAIAAVPGIGPRMAQTILDWLVTH